MHGGARPRNIATRERCGYRLIASKLTPGERCAHKDTYATRATTMLSAFFTSHALI